jgi:hypothetical protein
MIANPPPTSQIWRIYFFIFLYFYIFLIGFKLKPKFYSTYFTNLKNKNKNKNIDWFEVESEILPHLQN